MLLACLLSLLKRRLLWGGHRQIPVSVSTNREHLKGFGRDASRTPSSLFPSLGPGLTLGVIHHHQHHHHRHNKSHAIIVTIIFINTLACPLPPPSLLSLFALLSLGDGYVGATKPTP